MDTTGSSNVVFVKGITGGIEDYKHPWLSILPNPANDLLTAKSTIPGICIIEVTSLKGQVLFKSIMSGSSHQIDLSSFQKGLYFISLRSRDYLKTEKIIKQ